MDKMEIALRIEELTREIDIKMNEQRSLLAEALLLCQAYIDLQSQYER